MRVTQQLRYSVCGIFDLAYHGGEHPIRIEEIGRRQGIPPRYLEQIFQKLRRAGLVVSKRGPGGGYLLARPADQITLADVVRAVQGAVVRGPDEKGSQALGFIWERVQDCVSEALRAETVAGLCKEATRRGVTRAMAAPLMYEI